MTQAPSDDLQIIPKYALEALFIPVVICHAAKQDAHTLDRPQRHCAATPDMRREGWFLSPFPFQTKWIRGDCGRRWRLGNFEGHAVCELKWDREQEMHNPTGETKYRRALRQ